MGTTQTEQAKQPGNQSAALRDWVRALEATAPISANPNRLLPGIIEELAQNRANAPALLSVSENMTYGEVAKRANAYAQWALDQAVAKGETICLIMPNRPEYMVIWLGLTSVGVVVSLINTQLRGPALAHCINIVAPKHIIVAAELGAQFTSGAVQLANQPKIWMHGGGVDSKYDRIDLQVERLSGAPLTQPERRGVKISDRALLIYTSGSTGLPKAANVSHRRLLQWSLWFAGLMNTRPEDRMYDCLPMYHSVGGVVATGALLVRGGSVLIREGFSARQFWDDVIDGDCTLFQYIGELARYLLNTPDNRRERNHRLRLCCGNGLRADVWEKFQARFAIPRILEFYAATEGNFSLYNVEGKVGAIGRVPSFLAHRFPLALVKFDTATGEPVRDDHNFCIRCVTNEIGEAIGRISDEAGYHGGEFEGYSNIDQSETKILRNVFEPGDAWYRTGDLMTRDASGFFFFIDRVGDTFRWKGENVASSEVAATIMAFPRIKEANVYGVHVPGTEGAAGMAALVIDGDLDFSKFRQHLETQLPPYARPLFLRITDRIAATSTFKHTKSDLRRDGYNPALTPDRLYFDDSTQRAFVPVDAALFAGLQSGKVRV
jgi:fatty-acyl-CoA synthase